MMMIDEDSDDDLDDDDYEDDDSLFKFCFLGKVKAISTYQGLPAPPNNLPYITFEENKEFTFVSEHDESWWLVSWIFVSIRMTRII